MSGTNPIAFVLGGLALVAIVFAVKSISGVATGSSFNPFGPAFLGFAFWGLLAAGSLFPAERTQSNF